jgi:hypothetical protein
MLYNKNREQKHDQNTDPREPVDHLYSSTILIHTNEFRSKEVQPEWVNVPIQLIQSFEPSDSEAFSEVIIKADGSS